MSIAGLYTLVATCEARGINPFAYLADVIPRVGSPEAPARRAATRANSGEAKLAEASYRVLGEGRALRGLERLRGYWLRAFNAFHAASESM